MASWIVMPFFTFAQDYEIHGIVKDSLNNPLSNAIVLLSSTQNESNILSYQTSNAKGKYSFKLKKSLKVDSLWLIVRHIAFKTAKSKVPFQSATRNFKLLPKVQELDEVILEYKKKVEIKGDTIVYNVNALKTDKDYTIEEVLSRIPGVSVSENGQIKYEDKPISHLYINGVDLLEGRYNIATQGIPADAVKEIDIMKRHNHERIDIGRTESDDVAFNLKIKEGVSLVFGSVKSEAGIPLITGLLEGTPVYLKDDFQDIASFKFNNMGKTLLNFGSSLTSDNPNILRLKLNETPIIQPTNVRGSVLSDKYWLDNGSYSITNDALYKVSDSTLIKWNINYINELSKIENKSSTTFINNNDSSVILNRSNNQLRSQRVQVGFSEEINKRNFYLKNSTVLKYSDKSGEESSTINNNSVQANFGNNNFKLNNNTLIKTLVGTNNIIQSGLVLEYERQSEQLQVLPPVFGSVVGTNTISETTLQNIDVEKFNVGGFVDYSFKLLSIKWNANQSIRYNNLSFKSNLRGTPQFNSSDFPLSSDFDFEKLSFRSKLEANLNLGKMKFGWRLSTDLVNLNTNEKEAQSVGENNTFLLIQPFLSLRYKANTKWNMGISYAQDNSISDFSELYPALVLKSYNSLVQNPQAINRQKSQSLTPFVNYSNVLKSFFFNLRGKLTESESEFTFVNQLDPEGFIITEVVERPNSINNYSLSLSLSKGFLGSFNADLSYSFNYSENELFFNNQFLDAINRRHGVNFNLGFDNGGWFAFDYEAKFSYGVSQLPTNKLNNLFLFHTADTNFYISPSTRLDFGIETVGTKTSTSNSINNNTLFNIGFYYKPSKKVYLKAALLNIFNTSFFSTTNSTANFVNISEFSLRPRQFTIGFTYSL